MSQAEKLAQLQERVQALEGVRAGWLSDATAYPTRHFVRGEHATCPERIEALATELADERQKVVLLQAELVAANERLDLARGVLDVTEEHLSLARYAHAYAAVEGALNALGLPGRNQG